MKQLTKQEVFDIVYKFYRDGGKPGWDKSRGCVYFAPNGGRCAVGVMLSHLGFERSDLQFEDEGREYDYNSDNCVSDLEDHFGKELTESFAPEVFEQKPDGFQHEVENPFLQRLQNAHDKAAEKGGSREVVLNLQAFAKREGLTIPT